MSVEFDWLCTAAMRFVASASQDDTLVTPALPELPDDSALIDLAAHHRLLSLVHRTLDQIDSINVARSIRATAWAAYRQTCERNVAFELALSRAIGHLNSHDIRAFAHKGPALARWLYADPGLRIYVDLDILVNEDALFDAAHVLVELGYALPSKIPARYHGQFLRAAQQYDLVLSHPETGVMIELHWRTDARFFAENLDNVASDATVDIAGTRVQQLSARELLFALLIHGTKHKWSHLLWLLDIALLTKKIESNDWRWLVCAGKERHCEVRLAVGLLLAKLLFRIDIPELAWTPHARTRSTRLAEEIASDMRQPTKLQPLTWFADFRGDLRFNDRWQQSVVQTLQLIFAPNLRDWHHIDDHPGALMMAFPKRVAAAILRRLRPR
jgi:Uncharacterised nucleotidyltransferase